MRTLKDIPQITVDEHEEKLNAKRVTIVGNEFDLNPKTQLIVDNLEKIQIAIKELASLEKDKTIRVEIEKPIYVEKFPMLFKVCIALQTLIAIGFIISKIIKGV